MEIIGIAYSIFAALPSSSTMAVSSFQARLRRGCRRALRFVRRRMAASAFLGAVAFSRTGDLATGKFDDAVVIEQFGAMPSIVSYLNAAET